MYWTNNQRLSFFSVLFLLLYFIKEILSLRIIIDKKINIFLELKFPLSYWIHS